MLQSANKYMGEYHTDGNKALVLGDLCVRRSLVRMRWLRWWVSVLIDLVLFFTQFQLWTEITHISSHVSPFSGASCLSSMERYDTLTGVWSSCPPMNTRRRYCRLAVLDHCIYSLGGYDSTQFHASGKFFSIFNIPSFVRLIERVYVYF